MASTQVELVAVGVEPGQLGRLGRGEAADPLIGLEVVLDPERLARRR